jgi:hypothetical protein
MNMTHVTRINGVETEIKSVSRVGVRDVQVTEYFDGSTFSPKFAVLHTGAILPIHHRGGEIFIGVHIP